MDLRVSVMKQTDVAFSLAKRLMSTVAKDTNVVFSPLSIQVVLSLIASGTTGATLNQLLSFLKFKSIDQLNTFLSELVDDIFADGNPRGGPRLSFANGVWIDKSLSLKDTFKQVVDNDYKAATDQVDFQTRAEEVIHEVNSWAEKETNGLVKEVLPPGSVTCLSRLVFANALYFKGAWNEKFDSSKTKYYDFFLLNGGSVRVPFMTSKRDQMIRAYDDFKVLRLPYKQGDDKRRHFSMYFFLPDAKDGLPALVEKMGSGPGILECHIPDQEVEVGDFRIPRFKISFGFEASEFLKGFGLNLPFSEEGDLTEMVDSLEGQNLYVSGMYQKSFIEVNEEGSEAAAATGAVMSLRSIHYEIDFVADHPFLFLIREDITGTVMFIGKIIDPSAGKTKVITRWPRCVSFLKKIFVHKSN